MILEREVCFPEAGCMQKSMLSMYFSEISQHFNISQSRKIVKSFASNLLLGCKDVFAFWICVHACTAAYTEQLQDFVV